MTSNLTIAVEYTLLRFCPVNQHGNLILPVDNAAPIGYTGNTMQMPVLIRFFDKGYVSRLFLSLLLFSIALLGDGYLLVLGAVRYGVFRTLGVSASAGLIGMILVLVAIDTTIDHLREQVRAGSYPSREYAELGALVAAGILVLIPGFFTDAVAVLLYLPPLRRMAGFIITRPLRPRLREAYEHLKMQAFEGS